MFEAIATQDRFPHRHRNTMKWLERCRQRIGHRTKRHAERVADDLRVGLLQAAVDFGADTDPGGTRFAVFDAEAGVVPSPEIARFAKRALLGLPLSFEDLRAALERPAGLPA